MALADVDEDVLEELLAVALVQATADEVTPPLGSTSARTLSGSPGSATITGRLQPDLKGLRVRRPGLWWQAEQWWGPFG